MWEHSQCAITAWTEIHGSIRVNVDVDGVGDVDADDDVDDDEGEDQILLVVTSVRKTRFNWLLHQLEDHI